MVLAAIPGVRHARSAQVVEASLNLPEFPAFTPERLEALLARHGLAGYALVRLSNVGIFNAIFAVGDSLILRVPRQHPAFVEAALKEARAVNIVRALGVRTPALVAFDDALDVLPVPYGLYERVPGQPLEQLRLSPLETPEAYREVGRDLARLHSVVGRTGPLAQLTPEELPPPDAWPDELAGQGYVGTSEARWLSSWINHLKQRGADATPDLVFRHGDLQATNIMVDPSGAYVALLDWGACGWGDAAHDFAGVPLRAAPLMLQGYRAERDVPDDGSFEARVVFRQLQIALFLLRRSPQPDKSWAERPLGMMLDLLQSLATSPDERWRSALL
ncbi:phosphotransferase family protein [Deinococcus apachensis]|uniref:phosphotransferase family protein n=1 Tax=Deinococcus apachensis TaxID=309886 RepID=UPI0003816053|nr:aminoglycoside phosphotransferase family protein [Deinococcus apachensis]